MRSKSVEKTGFGARMLSPCCDKCYPSPVALAVRFWHMRSESLTGIRYKTYCCSKCQCDRYYPEMISEDIGKESFILTCPSCRMPQHTRVVYVNTKLVHLFAILLSVLGLCLVPYFFFKRCKRVRHFCSICGNYLGTSTISTKKVPKPHDNVSNV